MSHSTNSKVSSVNFCDVCNLSFETKKCLYKHQSYDSKHEELLEKMFDSDDEVQINVKPKVKAKAKPEVKAKAKLEVKPEVKAKRVPPPPTQST